MTAQPSFSAAPKRPRVALMVTCLVDTIRPSVGFAAVKLLEDAGCIVSVPAQTCCGQPNYNSGDHRGAINGLGMATDHTCRYTQFKNSGEHIFKNRLRE